MFVAADTQHQWARLVVFGERLDVGLALGLGRLLGLFLLLLLRRGGGIFGQ
jgi:hypothetical protein